MSRHSLQQDLEVMAERNRQRRQALQWLLAGGSAALLVACGAWRIGEHRVRYGHRQRIGYWRRHRQRLRR